MLAQAWLAHLSIFVSHTYVLPTPPCIKILLTLKAILTPMRLFLSFLSVVQALQS